MTDKETKKNSQNQKLIDYVKKRKSMAKESPTRREKAPNHIDKQIAYVDFLEDLKDKMLPWFNYVTFKKIFYCYRNSRDSDIRVYLKRQTKYGDYLEEVEYNKVAGYLLSISSSYAPVEWQIKPREARELAEAWMAVTSRRLEKTPNAVLFAHEPGLPLSRLPFEVVRQDPNWRLSCPNFVELLSRMDQPDAFMARVGSIFYPEADRKQAVWIFGPKDCGKSQIEAILRYVCGENDTSQGSYVSMYPGGMQGAHWKTKIVDARCLGIEEADPEYLNTESFKSLTGSSVHCINPKCKPMFQARINVLLWFYSNEPPLIDYKPELFERIIAIKMNPVSRDNMLGVSEYQARLKNELPRFLGACMDLYENVARSGIRIPCSDKNLVDASAQKDEWAIERWYALFEASPGSKVTVSARNRTMEALKIRYNKTELEDLHKIWRQRFNMQYGKFRIGNKVYTGYFDVVSKVIQSNPDGICM